MKKKIALIMCFLFAYALVSCGGTEIGRTTETSVTTVTTIEPNIPQNPQKLETKTKYDVLEVYGYDGFRYGKKSK